MLRDRGLGGGDDHVGQRLIFLRRLLLLVVLILVVRGRLVLLRFLGRGRFRRRGRHGRARREHEQRGKGRVFVRRLGSPGKRRGGASGANSEDRRAQRVHAERRGSRAKARDDFVRNFDARQQRPRRRDVVLAMVAERDVAIAEIGEVDAKPKPFQQRGRRRFVRCPRFRRAR